MKHYHAITTGWPDNPRPVPSKYVPILLKQQLESGTITVTINGVTRTAAVFKKNNGCYVYWSPFNGERVVIAVSKRSCNEGREARANSHKSPPISRRLKFYGRNGSERNAGNYLATLPSAEELKAMLSKWPDKSKLRTAIEKYGLECTWCNRICNPKFWPNGNSSPTLEHLIRLADGGTNRWDNLRVACRKCNNSRHGPNWKPEKA